MRTSFALAACAALILAGCASTPAVKSVCLPMKVYSKAEEESMAAAVMALPGGSILAQMITDYGAMRDADRACQAQRVG